MFLLHSSFHTKFESRFLQIDHQIKLSCRSNGFTVGITLPTPKCRSCRSEGHLSLQTSSFILPIGVSLKNALFQPRKKTLKLCWGQLGLTAQGMKNHWTSFSAAKKGSHWNFSHGIKTSVYMVFGLSWKKNNVFSLCHQKFCVPSKISRSSPVRSGVDLQPPSTCVRDVTVRAWLWRFPLGFVTFKRSAGG